MKIVNFSKDGHLVLARVNLLQRKEIKKKERTVFILFKHLLQLMLSMLHILVNGDLLNNALLI